LRQGVGWQDGGVIDPLQTGIYLGCLALFLATAVHVVRGWRPTDWLVGGLALLELALLVQLVAGIVLLAGDGSAEGGAVTFVGYLVGALLVLPAGLAWALGEPSRAGTAVLLIAVAVVAFLELRLDQVWSGV
jgi:hypothetical protein